MTTNPRQIKNPGGSGLVSLMKQTSNTQAGGSCLVDTSTKAWVSYIDSSAAWNLDYTTDVTAGSPTWTNYLKVNTSGIITPSVYSDILRARSGTATFNFQGQSGSAVGSVTDGGLWTLGITQSLNYSGVVHNIAGHLAVNTPTSPSTDESGFLLFSTNLKLNAYGNRYNATVGGSGISLGTRTAATSNAVQFWANQPADITSAASTVMGSMTHAGAWTLGKINASGTSDLTHSFSADGGCALAIKGSTSAGQAKWSMVLFNQGGIETGLIGTGYAGVRLAGSLNDDLMIIANNHNIRFSGNGTAIHGTCSSAGAWTLGPGGYTGAHSVNGYLLSGQMISNTGGAWTGDYTMGSQQMFLIACAIITAPSHTGDTGLYLAFSGWGGNAGVVAMKACAGFTLSTPNNTTLRIATSTNGAFSVTRLV